MEGSDAARPRESLLRPHRTEESPDGMDLAGGDLHFSPAPRPMPSQPAARPSSGKRIRVLLADDHAVVREGLRRLLQEEPDIEIVGEAANGRQAVDLSRKYRPQVIVMDVAMPEMNGLEATRLILLEGTCTNIVALSMHPRAGMGEELLRAGARAYLTKGGTAAGLLSAIRRCAAPS